ncbi:MAG: PEP-CTERM sorting domain-containing protein [Phycisphaerales bacterium]|nr:PEP-CTERM sorting domain-containing protein [Phycisphaerales bacterium]
MKLASTISLAAAAAACMAAATNASAAMIASDSAVEYNNPSPSNPWPGTANAGHTPALSTYSPTETYASGFGAWNIVVQNNQNSPYAGAYLGNNAGVAIRSSNNSFFVVYAHSPTTLTPRVDANRLFENSSDTGLGTLRAGQTFGVGYEEQSGSVGTPPTPITMGTTPGVNSGLILETVVGATTTPVFSLSFHPDSNDVMTTFITNSTGTTSYQVLTEANLQSGVNISFALNTSSSYTLTLAPVVVNAFTTLTYSGTVSGAINGADIFATNTNANTFFNNMAISGSPVPEPASLAMTCLGGVALLLVGRKRRFRA